jgi:hypothetical protein
MIDVNGSHGNQMILGRNFAITANEESGGYTESSIVEDQQMVDVLIKEYDNLFYLIKKNKDQIKGKEVGPEQNIEMIEDAIAWFRQEKNSFAREEC